MLEFGMHARVQAYHHLGFRGGSHPRKVLQVKMGIRYQQGMVILLCSQTSIKGAVTTNPKNEM